MADAVVKITLATVRDLLFEEINFSRDVSGEVGDVKKELERLQQFLEEVDRRTYEEPSALNFFKEMKRLCYRIEDVVDTYVAEVALERREQGIINLVKRIACSICEYKSVHEVRVEISRIKKDISKLTEEMQTYGILKTSLGSLKSAYEDGGRRTYGLGVPEELMVGRKKDIDLLVTELLNGANNVVSICGMGGLGKTTLAEKIYHHGDIRHRFYAFAWAYVSPDCKPESVLKDLLSQLNRKAEIKKMSETRLMLEVSSVLQDHKCLIVLDDIWKVADWERLKPAFALGAANSKVLITTRNESVAKLGFFHRLGVLSPDEAWELLQKKAFESRSPTDLGVEQLGREMVKKYGYLPLAISVLGSILRDKNSIYAWKAVYEHINFYLPGADISEANRAITQVLNLSYDDLPHKLKPCLLYMSQFQEDEDIRPERLYLMWIAEGIVSHKDQGRDETLMSVAERFLGELASKSMVQVKIDDTIALKEFKSCSLHALLRDLCLAKSEEEEFLKLMDFRGGKQPSLNPSSTSSLRRLVVYTDRDSDGVFLIRESTQSLRSLFIRGPESVYPDLITLPNRVIDFDDLKFLRVLNFENVNFRGNNLLEKIGELINLRMLGFKSCILLELPSCIGDLPFLHTLLLEALIEISCIICKIKQLRYLDIRGGNFPEKLTLSNLDELETFYGFDSRTCEIMDLSKLPNLRRLQALIDGNENLSKLIGCIEANVKRLDYTDLEIFDCEFASEQGMAILSKVSMTCNIGRIILRNSPIGKLPKYEAGFFPSLTVLNLVRCEILEDPMDTLERLPKLTELGLENSYKGKEMICHAKGFAQLRRLRLHSLFNLKKWRVEKGAMQCLSILELVSCDKLGMLPDGIRFITTLRELVIGDMPSEFKGRVEKGGEDFVKICHVNLVTISDY